MKRKRPKRKDVDLVHVCWGPSDQGVVSLKQGRWLYYVWSDHLGGHHASIPTVGIEDADFQIIMEPLKDAPTCYEATWDDVARLLNHRRFPLMERIGEVSA